MTRERRKLSPLKKKKKKRPSPPVQSHGKKGGKKKNARVKPRKEKENDFSSMSGGEVLWRKQAPRGKERKIVFYRGDTKKKMDALRSKKERFFKSTRLWGKPEKDFSLEMRWGKPPPTEKKKKKAR